MLTNGMTARKLWLLSILRLENITDAVEQLDIALLGVCLDSRNECPGHGTSGLGVDGSVGPGSTVRNILETMQMDLRCLVVFASRPHDNVGGRCSSILSLLVCIVASECGLG